MLDEDEKAFNGVVVPSSELRQLATLLSGSAQIIERMLSSKGARRPSQQEREDVEAQISVAIPHEGRYPDSLDAGLSRIQAEALPTSWNYHEMKDNEERISARWKGLGKVIEENPHTWEAYQQLLKLWKNLKPRRETDDIFFQKMYLAILPTESPEHNKQMVSDIGPLLALIKHRRHQLRSPNDQQNRFLWIGIALNELLDVPQDNVTQILREMSVKHALDVCHKRAVMPPILSQKSVFDQVRRILESLQLINLTTQREFKIPADQFSEGEVGSMSIQQASKAFSHQTPPKRTSWPRNEASISFRKLDLNVETLREIGRLRIEWTPYIDQHLQLDVADLTLRVFWFGSTYFKNTSGWWHIGRVIPREWSKRYSNLHSLKISRSVQDALAHSYEFLFCSPTRGSMADGFKGYRALPVPWWIDDYYEAMGHPLSKGEATMGDVLSADLALPCDIRDGSRSSHIGQELCGDSQAFERLGPFEDRVRILDAYMQSKKPSTLRGLWRDKRDSLQWYTLWVVIIFGGVSIFLGVFGLALTAAQTAAAFQQIGQ